MIKKFIFAFIVIAVLFPFPSFGGKDGKVLDTNQDEEKVQKLLGPKKAPLKRAKGSTFCVPRTEKGYALKDQPPFLQEEILKETLKKLNLKQNGS